MESLPAIIFVLSLGASLGSGVEWNGYVGKFDGCLVNCNGFWDLPITKDEALKSNPAYIDTGAKDPDFELDVLCLKGDPSVCQLYDINGKIAGIRISKIKKDLADDLSTLPFKYDEISIFNSTTFLGHDVWYATFLFTKPENVKKGGKGRTNTEETAEGLWVRLGSGWTEIPRDECEAEKHGWQRQGFIPWMGNHHTIGQTEDCSIFMPLLPLFDNGRLVGLALAPAGKYKKFDREWFEDVPYPMIKPIVPHGYKPCLQDLTRDYKVNSLHFYFVKHPRLILLDRAPKC